MSGFSYNTATRIIPVGAESAFDITGTYVLAVAASHTDFGIRIDGGSEQFWDVGIQIGGASTDLPFRQISVVNKGAADLTITLAHGRGDFADRRLTFTGGALPVAFDGAQPVTQSGVWNVGVTGLPAIDFNGAQPVLQGGAWGVDPINFNGAQPVEPITFAAPQPVTQSGDFAVQPITFAAPQKIDQGAPNDWRTPAPSYIGTPASVTLAAGTSALVLAGTVGISKNIVTNVGTETVYLRSTIGLSNTGLPVHAGQAVEVCVQGNVYASNASAASVTLDVHKEQW